MERRLQLAGCPYPSALFPPETVAAVYQHSQGLPRLINTICENALIAAYARQMRSVSPDIIDDIATSRRATVDLPEPDSPTSAVTRPRCRLRATSSTASTAAPRRQGLPALAANGEVLGQALGFENRRGLFGRHRGPHARLEVEDDLQRVDQGGLRGRVRVRGVRAAQRLDPCAGPDGRFRADGRWLVAAREDGTSRLWDLWTETGWTAPGDPHLFVLQDGGGAVQAVAFSGDGARLATGDRDGVVRLWDLTSRDPGRAGSSQGRGGSDPRPGLRPLRPPARGRRRRRGPAMDGDDPAAPGDRGGPARRPTPHRRREAGLCSAGGGCRPVTGGGAGR